jgi:conjugative relaxase-like TrwC/TraI family protein
VADRDTERIGVLNVVELTNGEYLISSVALGVEEYYLGVGEAPGVWAGAWAERLGLSGEVDAESLRSLIDGRSPETGENLLVGLRPRRVKAFDLTFSAPKSVSLLWAFATPATAKAARAAHDEAVTVALGFLEERAAVARRQIDHVRRRVPTEGWTVAGFVHRTSREGDPQIHTHCLVPNVVRRKGDGRHVAIDANPLYEWARAAGSIYQNHLQRMLGAELGVRWGPDRNNTREIEGFTRAQLRGFSKRSVQIERELEAQGASYTAPGLRMRADEAASLATRVDKDRSLTPANVAARWNDEAAELGLFVGPDLDAAVRRGPRSVDEEPTWEDVVAALVDADSGLCSRSARFGEADVVEHLCALSGGRWTTDQITEITARFVGSPHAVRLTPSVEGGQPGRRPAQWSTAVHRALEDATLATLRHLTGRPAPGVDGEAVASALDGAAPLGDDQVDAVRMVCGPGGSVRAVLSPAGFGKTAMVHTAARALRAAGRPVVAVATTAKAVGELEAAGLPAMTIARLRIQLTTTPLAPGTAVVLDEVSQTSTGDAHTVLAAVAATPAATVIVLGDPRQAQSVKAGGLAAEIAQLATTGRIPTAELAVNRRQHDPADRAALILLRGGRPAESQTLRAEHGWEHEHLTPTESRDALADAAVADIAAHGANQVGVLAVSHVDAEDVADRIRHRLQAAGAISGPAVVGPGWVTHRTYQAGDRVLLHTRHCRHRLLVNGAAGTVTSVDPDGLTVRLDNGETAHISATFVRGTKPDGSPNVSHAWARTIDGAQGGTWEACHLLGTNALDAYRGYTGQSRSRQPTHTYNTTAVPTLDHGGTLADQRTPSEQVLAALARPTPRPHRRGPRGRPATQRRRATCRPRPGRPRRRHQPDRPTRAPQRDQPARPARPRRPTPPPPSPHHRPRRGRGRAPARQGPAGRSGWRTGHPRPLRRGQPVAALRNQQTPRPTRSSLGRRHRRVRPGRRPARIRNRPAPPRPTHAPHRPADPPSDDPARPATRRPPRQQEPRRRRREPSRRATRRTPRRRGARGGEPSPLGAPRPPSHHDRHPTP